MSKLTLSERKFFADAPLLMDFRRSTEDNPADNCEYYNRQQLRTFVKEHKIPVIAFDAQHEGVSHDEGMNTEDEAFSGLSKRLELAIGAPVLLTHNLAVEHGLVNGSQGQVVDIVCCNGDHPNHDTRARRMPTAVVVDFPEYKRPAFFTGDGESTWVPLFPSTRKSENDGTITRTQYPLTLAWALTPWKAQGITLAKVRIAVSQAASTPGVLFTALTRVRHPDTLLLMDSFPSYAQIMRTRSHKNFPVRQHWERKAMAKFSRTIRRHMRDPAVYTPEKTWTAEERALADRLLLDYGKHTDADVSTHADDFASRHEEEPRAQVFQVWENAALSALF